MHTNAVLPSVLLVLAVILASCAPAAVPPPAQVAAPSAAAPAAPVASVPSASTPVPAPTVAAPIIPRTAPTATPAALAGKGPPKFRQPIEGVTKYQPAPWEDWTPADIKRGGSFTIGYASQPPHLDISLNNGTAVQVAAGQVYDFLVRIKSSYDADPYSLVCEPALAQSWEEGKDSKSVTFKLRPNVKWQNVTPMNGREFTSDDVKFSIEYYKKGGTLSDFFGAVSSVETPDKLTAILRLKERVPGFVAGVCGQTAYIMPHEIADKDKDFRNQAVGTGPFTISKFTRGDRMEFAANKGHWDLGLDGKPLPYLDSFKVLMIPDRQTRIAAFRAGRIDSPRLSVDTEAEADQIVRTTPNAVLTVALPDRSRLAMGADVSKPPFNDVRVRRAFSMSFDREEMGRVATEGAYLTVSLVPWPLFFDKPPTGPSIPYYKYDPVQAKKLLAEAGYPNGIQKTVAWYPLNGKVQSFMELMKAEAAKGGFDLRLQQIDYATWSSEWTGGRAKFGDKLIIGDSPPLGWDYESYLRPFLYSKGDRNYINIQDSEIDALLDKMAATQDAAEQKRLARQVYERELDQAYRPAVPAYFQYLAHSSKIKNYRQLPRIYLVETYNARFAWRSGD